MAILMKGHIVLDPEGKHKEFIDELKLMASKDNPESDPSFMVDDYAGGNIDDAYQLGRENSEIDMAQWILDVLGVDY